MNLLLNHIQTHYHETQRLIGITFDQFNTLVKQAELIEIRLNQSKETHEIRINRRGAGSPKKLSTSDQILLDISKNFKAPLWLACRYFAKFAKSKPPNVKNILSGCFS